MLGLSLELLIKAILIAQNPYYITKEGLNDKISRHELIDLLAIAGIKLSRDERNLVKVLEHYILWIGRYPIPKNFKKAADAIKEVMQEGIDYDLFDRLYAKLEKHPKLVEVMEKERPRIKWPRSAKPKGS
jgi:hypothetical protein